MTDVFSGEVFKALCVAFREELNSAPTLGEFLEVLDAGSREYYSSRVSFNAILIGGRRYRPQTEPSRVATATWLGPVTSLSTTTGTPASRGLDTPTTR